MGVTNKSVPQRIPVKITKKKYKKKPGGELICKNFGVNGKSEVSKRVWREGVGDQQRPKYSKSCPAELCSSTHKGA